MAEKFSSQYLNILQARGFIHQISHASELDRALLEKKENFTAYIGFDCTAPSLHVGSLVQIMLLYWLQQAGHKPIVLMGGGTTKVGDPSGKDTARQLLTESDIQANMDGIKRVFEHFLTFGATGSDALMVNNADWLETLNYIDFLRDYGRHFSVNRMLTFDSVKLRLDREQPLSFLEFNYMVLQAYDFAELYNRYGCQLQMGGSDQWGNIVNGIELGRRVNGADLYGLTTPLLTTSSGAKMGKTAAGAIWLNADQLSPYDYWQYWRNTEDADVGRFLKLFTTLPLDEIARLEALSGAEINDAKKILATEATALIHGREVAITAQKTAETTFEKGTFSTDLPTFSIDFQRLAEGYGVLTAFVEAELVPSTSEARRQIEARGLKINDVPLSDPKAFLLKDSFDEQGFCKLSMGKKKHALLKLVY